MNDSDLPHVGYDLGMARRALHALMRDPSDVSQAFRVVGSLPGRSLVRTLRRFRATPSGQRLLRERPELTKVLCDRSYLASLPPGSLGHAYLEFCDREGIDPSGLLEAYEQSAQDTRPLVASDDGDMSFMIRYLRDAHDLWHVATGYRTDLVGEPALVAFTLAQTRSPGMALIASLVFLRAGGHLKGMRKTMLAALVRGARSLPLADVDWLALLPRPLRDVRAALRIPPLRPYQPIWQKDFPDGKLPYL